VRGPRARQTRRPPCHPVEWPARPVPGAPALAHRVAQLRRWFWWGGVAPAAAAPMLAGAQRSAHANPNRPSRPAASSPCCRRCRWRSRSGWSAWWRRSTSDTLSQRKKSLRRAAETRPPNSRHDDARCVASRLGLAASGGVRVTTNIFSYPCLRRMCYASGAETH
jgi:hypothetical protein